MSCLGFLTPTQRTALAASSAAGPPLSSFASPAPTAAKVRRVRLLAGSPDPVIRESAALSALVPPDVLELLSADPSPSVRACVARNERTPGRLLERLAADPVAHVRGWVAAHRRTPAGLRDSLLGDPDPAVRAVVRWAAGWPEECSR